MHQNDLQLTKEDIGQLENVEQLIHFFARLDYDVDDAIAVDHATLGMDSEDLRQQIKRIHRLASDLDQDLIIYLLEVRSVTVSLTQTIARRFRERTEETLLVFTKDYEQLDFVLLDREIAKGKTLGKALKQIIRPRSLTVNRRNPDPVAMRVLKRFTFTEADGVYQWDKLRAAYDVAEWAEPEFNNRALFSDYYLKHRLTDPKLTPAWGEDVRPIGRRVQQLLSGARQRFTQKPEQMVRAGLYEPLFRELGFDFVAHKAGTSDTDEPDYKLYSPGDREKPVALALTYVWNRNLDDQDLNRDPDTKEEIPGALVVSVLEKAEAPWVIMTNGKLWRLYSATASNKATNYYEIDLEEALAAPDQTIALRYWWLLFRHDAFTGFLDHLLQQSADYAKALGDRLKDRVFTQIFPHFAAGFIVAATSLSRPQRGKDAAPTLDEVYQATLTFLYRLMFVLYAESLELLPLYEERGYRQLSLYKMKQEVAGRAGVIQDQVADKLKQAYSASETGLYERLAELFALIDTGSAALNLPTYNGGLFSQTNDNGEFLADYAIPDRYLALGLDRLCRDVDDKTQALAFIDYKSLGVRQLGSIYEGLLEFKLRIAGEKLAVIKEKNKEVYVPFAEAGSKRVQATLEKGDVYLENDKKERKATGSYYTPDYIVKYIVENTVGPVLARKFEALTPRLREAQKQYRQHKEKVLARGNDQSPELFWNSETMRQLADDCLNVRVLDPAMGSGHFLVEAVDFVSNRLIDFLNGWSDNPVWALLNRTREDILEEMERQRVTIDANKLTRVALLKRAALKRCIYGVDLNEMAVELAKVSLWLDAFTLGAPLSFLDHHLRHGNSLIGVFDVEHYIVPSSGRWQDLLRNLSNMVQIGKLADASYDEVVESNRLFLVARREIEPTIARFNVELASKFDSTLNPIARTMQFSYLDEKSQQSEPQEIRDKFARSQDIAAETNFFHWKLEFPEVFIDLDRQDWAQEDARGFDAVVGNPPYDELSEDALGRIITERDYLTEAAIFSPTHESSGRLNWYHYFIVLSLQLLSPKGCSGLIVPMSWMGDSFTFGVRKWMLENHRPKLIEAFPQKDNPFERVFIDAKLPTSIFVAEKNRSTGPLSIRVHPGKDILRSPHFYADPDVIRSLSPDNLLIPLVDNNGWKILEALASSAKMGRLTDIAAEPTSGEIIFNSSTHPYMSREQKPGYKLILRGSHVQRYEMVEEAKQGVPEYLNVKAYLENSREDSKAYAHRNDRIVYQEGSALDAWRRVLPAYLPEGNIAGHKICYFVNYKINKFALLAIFASNLVNWLVEKLSVTNSLPAYLIGNLPFPHINFTTPTTERERLTREIIGAYEISDNTQVVIQALTALRSGKSDVAHDVLAHLAKRMIDLNKSKQSEIKRFSDWIESRLKITPKNGTKGLDSLAGKTVIQGYLGDYQKGEPEVPWEDFYYRLHQNRNRFGVNLAQVQAQIQHEYEKSLAMLLPIKQQLATTDALIDQIVYKLYGLSDEEIELIERPAYEQALTEAKAKVLQDKKLQEDPEAASEAIAENILPAAKRFQSRVNISAEEARLNQDLPGWHLFAGDVSTFLLTGEYNIAHLPDHLDFSTSIIGYTKAVEQALMQHIFEPFRAAGYGANDCKNKVLQKFMDGDGKLTLGNFAYFFTSSEKALLRFVEQQYPGRGQSLFFDKMAGVRALLNNQENIDLRNKAAHSEVLSKEDARNGRQWALAILRHL